MEEYHKVTTDTINYFECLDRYREDPNRTNKDLLLEAECDIREYYDLSKESMVPLSHSVRK